MDSRFAVSFPRSIVPSVIFITLLIFGEGCSTVTPVPPPTELNQPGTSASAKRRLPFGWSDITGKSQLPQIQLWLVNADASGTMVLRELQTDDSLLIAQSHRDASLLANISLRSKFANGFTGKRVTRTPAGIDSLLGVCGYVYDENGLLRKVIVFEHKHRLFELELFQEKPGAAFEGLVNDQATLLHELLSDSP